MHAQALPAEQDAKPFKCGLWDPKPMRCGMDGISALHEQVFSHPDAARKPGVFFRLRTCSKSGRALKNPLVIPVKAGT